MMMPSVEADGQPVSCFPAGIFALIAVVPALRMPITAEKHKKIVELIATREAQVYSWHCLIRKRRCTVGIA